MATVTRLVATATPDPELDPRGTRSVSYGLQAWPDQLLIACPPATKFVFAFAGPPGSLGPALNSCDVAFA